MSAIKLYIATTIDGYIARPDGRLDWLEGLPNPDKTDYGYHDFYAGVDTVVMGRQTYEEVLGFGVDWPYTDCKTYVATTRDQYELQTPNTVLLPPLQADTIAQLKAESKKAVWLVGGGELVTAFLRLGAIDEMHLFVAPVVLGEGIPLFPGKGAETTFQLASQQAYANGGLMLVYTKTVHKTT